MSGKIVGSVRGQVLHLIYPPLVEGTVDYLTAEFSFSGDWDGLSKWAHFKQGSTIYDVPLTNDAIAEDQHLNLGAGTWDVYLHGSGDNRRITTTTVRMKVLPYLDEDGEPLPEVPLTFAEVLDQRAQRIQAVAYAVEAGESDRKEAERSRELSEFARVQAEAERTGAEAIRDSAETARKNAEQDRVSSENARSSAEDTRKTNEEARQASEAIREQNEEARVEAEKNRKDGITPHIGDNGNWYLGDTDTGKPSRGKTGAGMDINGATVGQIAKITAVDGTGKPTAWEPVDMPISFKPAGKSYLTFSSPNSFTLVVNDAIKHWDGTLEYFSSDKTWTVWDGTTTLSAIADDGEYVLYLRGTGNTVITGNSENYRWVLTGSNIACIGNIENLLDYATVASGEHPTMANNCYYGMFYGCTSLTQAPALSATTLSIYCYSFMFYGCTSLTQAPALPATTLADSCYEFMFCDCTALTQAPELPATTLADSCYYGMFMGCTSLTQTPALPVMTLVDSCYYYMFQDCTNLIQPPELPATTLANGCYRGMFQNCTSLTQAPELPAMTLANYCYQAMFLGCTGLTQAPALPAMTLANYCYHGMFQGCTSLKLSSTQTGEYTQEYRIPSSGEGVVASGALTSMFTSTGGTFTGTPAINTTYYLSSDNMIVRETEIDTLNGYVGSMIDVAIAEHTSNPLNITGATVGQIAKITAVDDTGKPTAWEPVDMPISFKPEGKSYLTFSSPSSFTLKVNDSTKHWNGILEFFASDKTWTVWDGTSVLSAVADDGEYVLYLRGTGNTVITGSNSNYRWVLTGSDIRCIGNIENLLDYATVESGNHPTMANSCYANMFYGCTALTQAPALPATTLADSCYQYMFQGCASLTQAPALLATTLANSCYNSMFFSCKSLTEAPVLPATTLANNCYAYMFAGCKSLTKAPALHATTLEVSCYAYMFQGCKSLTEAPALPATTLANNCYAYMFAGCTSLTKAPTLPATMLEVSCYEYMFYVCTALTQAPALPATTLNSRCYESMFEGCTSLTQAPALPATTLNSRCYNSMFKGCTSLKFSSTQTGEYTQEYRIPSSGEGVTATNALIDMFTSTGGTFTGTPAINTTYYLSSDNMIVRETEIDTLNGYVGSMIDVAIAEHTSNPLNINGATVGQIAKITAVDGTGKPTAWAPVDMPDALPNPNALTFTGAVTGSYDGSAPLSVEIPSGGGGSSGGSGKAKSQILIDQKITELTASLSVTLEHDFHNLTAIINCGSDGVALTAGSDGTAVASKIGLMINTTDFGYNARKVALIDISTGTWKTMVFGAEWSDDLSVFKRGFSVEITTNTGNKSYISQFGGTTAMYGTLGTDDNAPRTGKTANIVVNGAYLNVGTRVVLWGEYYE